jgi:hypothetical protein
MVSPPAWCVMRRPGVFGWVICLTRRCDPGPKAPHPARAPPPERGWGRRLLGVLGYRSRDVASVPEALRAPDSSRRSGAPSWGFRPLFYWGNCSSRQAEGRSGCSRRSGRRPAPWRPSRPIRANASPRISGAQIRRSRGGNRMPHELAQACRDELAADHLATDDVREPAHPGRQLGAGGSAAGGRGGGAVLALVVCGCRCTWRLRVA